MLNVKVYTAMPTRSDNAGARIKFGAVWHIPTESYKNVSP
jgi:hypothetical protein